MLDHVELSALLVIGRGTTLFREGIALIVNEVTLLARASERRLSSRHNSNPAVPDAPSRIAVNAAPPFER